MSGQLTVDAPTRSTWSLGELTWLYKLLRRHFLMISASTLTGVALMIVYMAIKGPSYDVSTKVLVKVGREMSTPTSLDVKEGSSFGVTQKRPEDIASEVEILSNPRLITQTVEALGEDFFFHEDPPKTLWQHLKRFPRSIKNWGSELSRQFFVLLGLRPYTTRLERLALGIATELHIETVRKSDVIEVSLGFPDPVAGEKFLSTFLSLAEADHVEAYRSPGDSSFFLAERDARSKALDEAEKRLLVIRSERNSIWSGPEQRSLLLKAETDLQQALNIALVESSETEAEINDARERLKTLTPEIKLSSVRSRSANVDDLKRRIDQLELDLLSLGARYDEGSPEIRDVKRQISALKALQAEEPEYRIDSVTTGQNPQYEQLARDLAIKENIHGGQLARIKELTSQQADLRASSIAAQELAIEISRSEREIAQLRRSVESYDKALEEARINEAMDATKMSNLKVIMPPTAETIPSSPSLRRFLILGAAAGLVLSIALVIARDVVSQGNSQVEKS